MENALQEGVNIEALLAPETDLEHRLIIDPEFRQGLLWGKPRFGHPEGQIVFHIREVLDNIDRTNVCSTVREQLRQITFLHDTFKYKEIKEEPRDWKKHHGVYARKYAEAHLHDSQVLDVIELHDEAYYCWRYLHIYRDPDLAQRRLEQLLSRVGDHIQLYYLFFKCDTRTGDKNQAPLKWFENTISNIEICHF